MRVGVVCEGPTDWHAIVCFLEASLTDRGTAPVFVEIQPEMDKTNRANGGWGAALNWLKQNPPESRTQSYFNGGLFDDDLSAKQCDVMVFQMDADILSDCIFQDWTKRNLDYDVANSGDPVQRGNEIRSIIEIAGDFEDSRQSNQSNKYRRPRSNRRRLGASPIFVCCPVIPRC